MELTEKLKEDMAKCQTRDEAKDNLKESRVVLNEEELDSIVGQNEQGVGDIHEKTQETYDMVRRLDEFIGKNKQTAQEIKDIISKFDA